MQTLINGRCVEQSQSEEKMSAESVTAVMTRPRVLNNILETLGNTPLVRLHSVTRGVAPEVLAKDMATAAIDEPLEVVMNLLSAGADVVLVTPPPGEEGGGVLGILTKIDVLDYIASHCL